MEREAEQLMIENLSKNLSDADEYPAMMAMHARCISIISHLWGVQKGEKAIGSATTGSSEAIHLGGLAMKRRWQEKREKDGKDKSKPNIIMGSNAQGMSIHPDPSMKEPHSRGCDRSYCLLGQAYEFEISQHVLALFIRFKRAIAERGTIYSGSGKVCSIFRSRSSHT